MNAPDAFWEKHTQAWRDPMEIVSLTQNIAKVDPKLLNYHISGEWWNILADLGIAIFITREYEHLILAFSLINGEPGISFFPLPHPSGIAFDKRKKTLHIASTRNPNQIFSFEPASSLLPRKDIDLPSQMTIEELRPMLPTRSVFLPGCTYIHDLAMISSKLYANAVGHNAVIRFDNDGRAQKVWWPQCIEVGGQPDFSQNYLQLNSIAAANDLKSSFFTASTDTLSSRRPGHKNFKVDKVGVVFSGKTRQVVARGLTRPHSARIHNGVIWVGNSGYGELGFIENEKFSAFQTLPGWTRGLKIIDNFAFVGTSRIIPRFRNYAPGLDVEKSVCGIFIVSLLTGEILGSIQFPYGNQIFSIESVPREISKGFTSLVGKKRASTQENNLYYSFSIGK